MPSPGGRGAGGGVLRHGQSPARTPGTAPRGRPGLEVHALQRVRQLPARSPPRGQGPSPPSPATASARTGRCTKVSPAPATQASPVRSSGARSRSASSSPPRRRAADPPGRGRPPTARPGRRRSGPRSRRRRTPASRPHRRAALPTGAPTRCRASGARRTGSRRRREDPHPVAVAVAAAGNAVSENPNSRVRASSCASVRPVGAVHHGQLVAGNAASAKTSTTSYASSSEEGTGTASHDDSSGRPRPDAPRNTPPRRQNGPHAPDCRHCPASPRARGARQRRPLGGGTTPTRG